MKFSFSKYWFIISIIIVCFIGYFYPKAGNIISPFISILIALLMFMMSFTLETKRLSKEIRNFKGILFSIFFSFIMMPIFGYFLAASFFSGDYFNGIIILACTSTTLSSCIIWTRLAKGNDALALVSSVLINSVSAMITPILLLIILGARVHIPAFDMIKKLVVVIVIPVIFGQVARKYYAKFADKNKENISIAARLFILLSIYVAISKTNITDFSGIFILIISIIALKIIALFLSYWLSTVLKYKKEDSISNMFVSTGKTLPMTILITTTYFSAITSLPIIIYNISQLVIDSVVVETIRK